MPRVEVIDRLHGNREKDNNRSSGRKSQDSIIDLLKSRKNGPNQESQKQKKIKEQRDEFICLFTLAVDGYLANAFENQNVSYAYNE